MKDHILMIFGALFWMSTTAPGPILADSATTATPPKEDAMFMDELKTTTDTTIPPIDRAAPAKFETAAFGLG